MERDNKLIDDLLEKTDNLKDVTENIIEFFNTDSNVSAIDENYDFGTLFLADVCGALAVTVNESMTTMYDRACRIETLISELPSLDHLDDIMIQLCGYSCLESCPLGFPSRVLWKYKFCSEDDDKRKNRNGPKSNDQYAQVF